jgi:hypothetical protein
MTPDGHRTLMLRAANPDRAGPSIETLMGQGNVITRNEIAGWCSNLPFTPTDHELEEMAYALNLIRVTKPREEAIPNPPELDRVAKALALLSTDVPVLLRMQQKALDERGPNATARSVLRGTKLVIDLANLWAAVQTLRNDQIMVPSEPKRRSAAWHRDLKYIAFLFGGIIRKHRAVVSLTNAAKAAPGPGVEFIRTALARAGIHHDNQAIAKEMARAAKDKLRICHPT